MSLAIRGAKPRHKNCSKKRVRISRYEKNKQIQTTWFHEAKTRLNKAKVSFLIAKTAMCKINAALEQLFRNQILSSIPHQY